MMGCVAAFTRRLAAAADNHDGCTSVVVQEVHLQLRPEHRENPLVAGVLAARGHQSTYGLHPPRIEANELRTAHNVTVTILELDISSLVSVRSAVAHFRSMVDLGTIDSLTAVLCNAGGRFDGAQRYSPEGYELTFATNCLERARIGRSGVGLGRVVSDLL